MFASECTHTLAVTLHVARRSRTADQPTKQRDTVDQTGSGGRQETGG